MSKPCLHLSPLQRADGIPCSICDGADGHLFPVLPLAAQEIAHRYDDPVLVSAKHQLATMRRHYRVRGVVRFFTPYLIVTLGVIALVLIIHTVNTLTGGPS